MSTKAAEKATAAQLATALAEVRAMLVGRAMGSREMCIQAEAAGAHHRAEKARQRLQAYRTALAELDHITAGLL